MFQFQVDSSQEKNGKFFVFDTKKNKRYAECSESSTCEVICVALNVLNLKGTGFSYMQDKEGKIIV